MLRLLLLIAFCCVVSPFCVSADEKAGELAKTLPAQANTISVVHMKKILTSPRAKSEDWAAKQRQNFVDGHIGLPPWVETLVVGSLTHPAVPEEVWATAIVEVEPNTTIDSVASENGFDKIDIAGLPAIQTPVGSYVAEVGDNRFAAYRPGHRQEAIKWFKSLSTPNESVSDYLIKAASLDSDIVMGIDLTDMLDVNYVESYLKQDKRFTAQRGLIPRLVPLLSQLHGVILQINIGQTSSCEVQVNFRSEVGPSAGIVKTLFLTFLEDGGAEIEEFKHARITAVGETAKLSCELSDASVMRILSLIVPPRVPLPQETIASSEKAETPSASDLENAKKAEARAAQRYVDSVKKLTLDLRKASERIDSYRSTIAWHRSYADKIDRLSTHNVPDELVSIGSKIAQEFRGLARSLNGQAVTIDAHNNSIVYDYQVDPGWTYANIWGGAGYRPTNVKVDSNLEKVREKQAQEVIKGQADRDKIWELIDCQVEEMEQIAQSIK